MMSEEHISGALDDTPVFVRQPDDSFAVMGCRLRVGQEVEVATQRSGMRSVIIKRILSDDEGIQTCEFEWAKPLTPKYDFEDGKTIIVHDQETQNYYLRGLELVEGETRQVSLRAGGKREVIVGEVLDIDVDGVQTARFTWPLSAKDYPPGTGRFTRLPDGKWAVRGKDIKPGDMLCVARKNKPSQSIIVEEILSEENGIQTATFTNPPQKQETNE